MVRSENELMTVICVTDNLTSTAALNVAARGVNIGTPQFPAFLSRTRNEAHDSGDEVFICDIAENVLINRVLQRILLAAGTPSSVIPFADWGLELSIWHPDKRVNTVFYKPQDSDKALLSCLQPFMLDMWFDPVDREIKLKDISEWHTADRTLKEGKEIHL